MQHFITNIISCAVQIEPIAKDDLSAGQWNPESVRLPVALFFRILMCEEVTLCKIYVMFLC